jgi:hypothetical protein
VHLQVHHDLSRSRNTAFKVPGLPFGYFRQTDSVWQFIIKSRRILAQVFGKSVQMTSPEDWQNATWDTIPAYRLTNEVVNEYLQELFGFYDFFTRVSNC